ncbi:transmembrane protease serine 3-like [Amphibalanus amphitrite]|uniref:transmembrane protease serine 3-like n=1 Tax=Amphibalanus amphitrite TaxID=1232801 RepID=UPI001C92339C|nr:transmembrane protease serine 3-like [Amphibalanus amphitrite]
MKTCQLLLLGCLLAGALALPSTLQSKDPRKPPPEDKKPPPEEKKPEPEENNRGPEGKKPPPEKRKPAPKGDTGVPSPRSDALSCGSHVVAEGSTAVIESPNYPSNYPNDEDCVYTLTTDTGKDLELSCEAFDLESHSQCRYDWLRVNGIKYCGSSGPSTVAAPQLDIDFHSDYSVVRSGYRCTVTVVEPTVVPAGSQLSCGRSRLALGQHTITDGDGDYSNDVDCYYQLYADQAGDQLSVTCSQFDVESHSSCAYDWLSLNGNKFCGSNGPSSVAAIDQMAIHWHTDYSVVRSGFVCAVTVGEASPPTTTAAPPPPADNCACGNVNRASRIVGGVETEANEYPWQAGLVSTGDNRTWCGGTVINSRYVLTAAHCTAGTSAGSIQVLLREHLINQDDGEIRFNIAQIKNHPNYNSGTNANDFSLLKLATAIIFPADNKIAPACLPTASNDFVGADAIVTGFGTTSPDGPQATTLREVTVPVISNSACQSAYSDYSITSNMLCAGLLGTGGKDSCQGDSGGPLVSLENNRYSLIGVVSWGIGCADPNYPGVYARVTDALSWISANAADGEYCSDPAAN